jgi:hypothetical protein
VGTQINLCQSWWAVPTLRLKWPDISGPIPTPQVMRQVQELPEFLLPMPRSKLVPPSAANVNSTALARWFRKGCFQAFRHRPSWFHLFKYIENRFKG